MVWGQRRSRGGQSKCPAEGTQEGAGEGGAALGGRVLQGLPKETHRRARGETGGLNMGGVARSPKGTGGQGGSCETGAGAGEPRGR